MATSSGKSLLSNSGCRSPSDAAKSVAAKKPQYTGFSDDPSIYANFRARQILQMYGHLEHAEGSTYRGQKTTDISHPRTSNPWNELSKQAPRLSPVLAQPQTVEGRYGMVRLPGPAYRPITQRSDGRMGHSSSIGGVQQESFNSHPLPSFQSCKMSVGAGLNSLRRVTTAAFTQDE